MKRFKKFVAECDKANAELLRFQQLFEQVWVDRYVKSENSAYNSRHELACNACEHFFETFGKINGWYYTEVQYNTIKRFDNGLE